MNPEEPVHPEEAVRPEGAPPLPSRAVNSALSQAQSTISTISGISKVSG